MIRNAASKVAWVGRTASMVLGLAVVLALVVGVASTALAANGQPFLLGKLTNAATAITGLTANIAGPALQVNNSSTEAAATALNLNVASGKPPLKVNASAGKATNLNSDKLDGKDSAQLGVNGLETVRATSAFDSNSPKFAQAFCPAGKRVVGTGFNTLGGKTGSFPNQLATVVVDGVYSFDTSVEVDASEEEPTALSWQVTATAICATAAP